MRPSQPWILYLTAGLAALGVDGIIRGHPRWHYGGPLASLVYLFLPAIAVVAAGLFIDEAVDGYARPAAAAGGGVALAVVAFGEFHTVNFQSRLYGPMRLVLAVATYLAAFAIYTVVYTRDLDLPVAAAVVGVTTLALAMELLRESRLLGPSSLLVGIGIGVSIAELRLALYFFPLDGLLAGALLIIGFYLATGLVHHLLDHDLEWSTTAEYLLVAGVSTAAVVVTRVFV
ncbi:MAG: hypothetical protein HUU14_01635 [Dehalococcoidia bacterium]|nr:MAG: hypothetical protein EDM76_00810 [bacterium]MCE7928096.1 hypothetical protein [Chloroflexi bacterium CFX7]MCK6564555.1 hypothetical protein [Dehalococcoidia bacterium]MCL4230888.1 hypothetical protein [Dehalococcoidia bacterium]NUQ54571.1 hypothetical protein [Dehalococcoidia bacterium]